MVPRGTAPYVETTQMCAGMDAAPETAVETRSIVVLKSLVIDAEFLSRMTAPMSAAERRAGLVSALPIPDLHAVRTLTVCRRRQGILPAPAGKLIEQLRNVVLETA